MICYEEFDPNNRYPVVLPCGHTYVCAECANRIDRCMECRTSVFEEPAITSCNTEIMSAPSRGRSNPRSAYSRPGRRLASVTSHDTQNGAKPDNLPKKRLPLPKNVVLMSLMHATELASTTAEDHHNLLKQTLSDDEGEDEDEKIARITEIAAGACGTYAVASKKGLQIIPRIPKPFNKKQRRHNTKKGDQSNYVDWESHVDNIIERNSGIRAVISIEDEDDNHKYKDEVHLRFGDRVQVVTIVDGWAKLARGYGFVHCKSSADLIKVGGALDKACNLEAMILSRSLRRNELRLEQARVERDALSIMNDMQQTLSKEEDLTVIAAEAFSTAAPTPTRRECRDDQDYMQLMQSTVTESESSLRKSAAHVVRDELREEPGAGLCFPRGLFSLFNCNNSMDSTTKVFPSTLKIGQDDMVAGAQQWRLKNGKEAVSGTDFQTGISGHHAMQSTEAHPHPHNFLEKEKSNSNFGLPKMSQHSGLTFPRRFRTSLSFG